MSVIFTLVKVGNIRYRIHILDLDPASFTASGWLEDISLVEKYTMTDEDYDKREG